jgi:hypothetical protein
MSLDVPAWLRDRGGDLRPAPDGISWAVMVDGQPQYLLAPVPAGGQFGCRVMQTINSRRFDCPSTWPTWREAVQGGLDVLRGALGW